MKKIKITEAQAKLLGIQKLNENEESGLLGSAGVAMGDLIVRIVIEGASVPKYKDRIIQLVLRQDPTSNVAFFDATGKIVGNVKDIRLQSIARDIKALDPTIEVKKKAPNKSLKENVKNVVKITKEQYNRIFASGLINESDEIKGGLNRVNKEFKKEFSGSKIQNIKPVSETDFDIKAPVAGIPNSRMKAAKSAKIDETEEKGDSFDKEVVELIKYLYRKSDTLSSFWKSHGLSYDAICNTLLSKGLIISKDGRYELSKNLGSPEAAIKAVTDQLSTLLPTQLPAKPVEVAEDNYPAGAKDDPSAPWNQKDPEMTTPEKAKEIKLTPITYNDELVVLKDPQGQLYAFYHWSLETNDWLPYASVERTYVGRDEEGEPDYDYDYESAEKDADVIANYVNDNLASLSKGEGLDDWESGVDLVKLDEPLKQDLLRTYDKDKNIVKSLGGLQEASWDDAYKSFKDNLRQAHSPKPSTDETPEEKQARIHKKLEYLKQKEKERQEKEKAEIQARYDSAENVDEMTGASSAGAFTTGANFDNEMNETTTVQSAGNFQYDTPGLANVGRNGEFKKGPKTKAQKTPQWAGGEFVEQPKCSKLDNNKEAQNGGCNQGASSLKTRKAKGSINAPSLGERINEALKLQHDKKNNKLIVISDLEGKAASQETFSNKNVLKQKGFVWNGNNWAIAADKLDVAKETLSLINKAEYIINTLEDVEDAIETSGADNKSLLKSKLDQYIADLANATDEAALSAEIRRYLTFFSKFHDYSFFNRILIFIQRPDATRVASYKKWQDKFRQVKKGAKGITVLAPIISKAKTDSGEKDDVDYKQDVKGFRAVNVFDISDTEPIDVRGEVPKEPQWWGDNTPSETADELFKYASEVASTMGIKVTQSDAKGGEKGFAAGDHINISSDVSGAGRLSTMIHEIAHELMHFKSKSIFYQDEEVRSSSALKELQAESVSYVVLKHYGLPVSHHTTYLALWKANKEKIQSNLEVISKVSQFIIDKIDEEAELAAKNKENQLQNT